jgi:hypothetical protein
LLDWNGGPSALVFEPTGGPTDPWNAEWTADLGAAQGARYQVGSAWRRDFAGGTVVVNPTSASSATVALGRTYVRADGSAVTTVTLAPATAVILRTTTVTAPPQMTLTATIDKLGDVKLAWGGGAGTSVVIVRDGVRVALVPNTGTYGERVRLKSTAYTYKVCEADGSRCSLEVTVPSSVRKLAGRRSAKAVHPQSRVHHRPSRWTLLSRS